MIARFNTFDTREGSEIGVLFENFVYMELYKKSIIYNNVFDTLSFWRNKKNKEIDIIQENALGQVFAYECKWTEKKVSFTDFKTEYPESQCLEIHRDNVLEILKK